MTSSTLPECRASTGSGLFEILSAIVSSFRVGGGAGYGMTVSAKTKQPVVTSESVGGEAFELPVVGEPPVAGMFWSLGDARFGLTHLDIEQPDEPHHAVRAFAVDNSFSASRIVGSR